MTRSCSKLVLIAFVSFVVTAHAARAVDVITSNDVLELKSVRAKIAAKDWGGAVTELRTLAATHQVADVYSLLGFSLRNMGDYAQARTYYAKALDFDPNHRGAHEYLGELYLKTGEMDKARAMLTKLEKLCPGGCEELDDLRKHIAEVDGKGAAVAK